MHIIPIAFAATLATLAAQAASAAVVSAVPTVNVRLGEASIEILLPPPDAQGSFRGSFSLVLCDGSVREATACAANEVLDALVSVSALGSIFPFIDGVVSFTDFGTPTVLSVTFSTVIPEIVADATTALIGSVTVPADRSGNPVAPSSPGGFIEGYAFGPGGQAVVLALGDTPITPDPLQSKTVDLGPIAGVFDCTSLDGCTVIALAMGLNGLGGGTSYSLAGKFDMDAGPAPIPLPASVAGLAGALVALGFAAHRRRRN